MWESCDQDCSMNHKYREMLFDLLNMAGRVPPPGCTSTFVPHPYLGERGSVEVAFMFEHRFAFTYWLKWMYDERRKLGLDHDTYRPPDLITWDWHDDTGGECDFDPERLGMLNTDQQRDVSLFAWAGLRQQNDGHIAPAVWLNALGDVYVIQKQRDIRECKDMDRVQLDRYGNKHLYRYFMDLESFAAEYEAAQGSQGVYWDVDLDFFTHTDGNPDLRYNQTLSKQAIKTQVNMSRLWMQQILCDLKGMTIALEPNYTGGLTKSLELYKIFESSLFESPLFSESCSWKRTF